MSSCQTSPVREDDGFPAVPAWHGSNDLAHDGKPRDVFCLFLPGFACSSRGHPPISKAVPRRTCDPLRYLTLREAPPAIMLANSEPLDLFGRSRPALLPLLS